MKKTPHPNSSLSGKRITTKKAFTLIEIIVAITITSMVLVSIVQIFLFSGMFSKKIDSSRIMQENIKNFTDIIAEDVRNNGIDLSHTGTNLPSLKIKNGNEYYRAVTIDPKKEGSECKIGEKRCILLRIKGGVEEELINSWIAFEDLKFDITGTKEDIPKVTMYFTVRPATGKGLASDKIKNAKIIMQTTFSERLYKYNK